MSNSRVYKSLLNVRVGLLFYFVSLILAFFSRKIFLENLGANFIGLVGTLNSILGFLNIAELGIGSSVCFFLYKPIEQNDKKRIEEILSVLGYMYRRIGQFILLVGILLSFLFPVFFEPEQANIDFRILYFAFYSFLLSSVFGYFINYLQVFLTADQKNYVVIGYSQTISIIKTILQILLAYYYKNLYVWVGVEFLFSLISYILINQRVRKEYPWLRSEIAQGKHLLKKYPTILEKTKQIFIQKIKDFLLNKSDEILIFFFVSLKMVAFYGNYMIVFNKLIYLMNTLSNGMGTGVGNLVAENDSRNIIKVFWELTAIRFLIIGAIVFSLFLFMQSFILCWLGSQYLLSDLILYLLLINIFIMFSRGVVEMYIHAYGLYADVWASWAELIVNIAVTLLLAYSYGITGLLLGKILSVAGIALIWKPYYLFQCGLKLPYINYWKGMLPYYLIFALFMILIVPIKYLIIDVQVDTFSSLILYGLCIFPVMMFLYFLVLYKITDGMKYFVVRIPFLCRLLNNKK